MDRLVPFSAAAMAANIAETVVTALDRLGNERGLREGELAQLAAFEALQAEAHALLPVSRSMYALNDSTEPFRQQLRRCAEATAVGVPWVDLLDMGGAVPADWRRLPLSLDVVLWLGVTKLVDDLALICASPPWSGQRHRHHTQISMLRQLQAALGRVIELSSRDAPAEQIKRATDWAVGKFARSTDAIGDDLPAICAEAAAVRARRQ